MLDRRRFIGLAASFCAAIVGLSSPAFADGPAASPAPGAAAEPNPTFSVLKTWLSGGHGEPPFYHVRINLHPVKATTFLPQNFRIRMVSGANGAQTAYALDHTAPSKRHLNFASAEEMVDKPEVSPDEDFGDRGAVRLAGGDALVLVLTFAVPTGAETKEAASTLEYVQ